MTGEIIVIQPPPDHMVYVTCLSVCFFLLKLAMYVIFLFLSNKMLVSGLSAESLFLQVKTDPSICRESRQRQRRRKRKKQIKPPTRCASLSSMTESSSSLNIITVTLDMEACSFLGFSIYSNSDDSGESWWA